MHRGSYNYLPTYIPIYLYTYSITAPFIQKQVYIFIMESIPYVMIHRCAFCCVNGCSIIMEMED